MSASTDWPVEDIRGRIQRVQLANESADCPVKVAAVDGGEDRPEQAGPTRPATASGRSGYVWDHTSDRVLASSPAWIQTA